MGNHDIRIDNYIASNANELDGYIMSLAEHFPDWDIAWAFEINGTEIRHRFRSGIHSGYNSSVNAGISTVTGHTHALECKPYHDLRGRRYGVQTGTVSDLDGPQFEYQGGRPSQACSGFAVLTYREGVLLQPELCQVVDGKAYFRGDVVA